VDIRKIGFEEVFRAEVDLIAGFGDGSDDKP
jgi:hypothetical protein